MECNYASKIRGTTEGCRRGACRQAGRDPGKRAQGRVEELKGASKSMYESMSEQQLDEFASTKRKGKPEHVAKTK